MPKVAASSQTSSVGAPHRSKNQGLYSQVSKETTVCSIKGKCQALSSRIMLQDPWELTVFTSETTTRLIQAGLTRAEAKCKTGAEVGAPTPDSRSLKRSRSTLLAKNPSSSQITVGAMAEVAVDREVVRAREDPIETEICKGDLIREWSINSHHGSWSAPVNYYYKIFKQRNTQIDLRFHIIFHIVYNFLRVDNFV